MNTRTRAGFEPARRLFGQLLHGYCTRADTNGCTLVRGVRYDARRGYVNAVGPLSVDFRGVTLRTFSPLGEAIFAEIPPEPPAGSGPRVARQR